MLALMLIAGVAVETWAAFLTTGTHNPFARGKAPLPPTQGVTDE